MALSEQSNEPERLGASLDHALILKEETGAYTVTDTLMF